MVPKEDFQQLLYANKDVASRLIQMLADNVREKEEQLLHLAYHSVRKRVADAILKLYEQLPSEGDQSIHILREDLANIVGTAKESVIRMLSEFKDDGYLKIENGVITVIDAEKLRQVPG
jgi:CRP-like cAMP-binding protein